VPHAHQQPTQLQRWQNITADPGKGTTVAYNDLNLPECVTFATGGKIFYRYDAAGRKLA
jgi:hypothetical protein